MGIQDSVHKIQINKIKKYNLQLWLLVLASTALQEHIHNAYINNGEHTRTRVARTHVRAAQAHAYGARKMFKLVFRISMLPGAKVAPLTVAGVKFGCKNVFFKF